MPVVVAVVIVLVLGAGWLIWAHTVPATVIVPKGKMPPPPNFNGSSAGTVNTAGAVIKR